MRNLSNGAVSNVVQMCGIKLAREEWFREPLMKLVLEDGCSALKKLLVDNKFTAWRVFTMGTESEMMQMKVCAPHIDNSLCDAKVNLGFKWSLFLRTWLKLSIHVCRPTSCETLKKKQTTRS